MRSVPQVLAILSIAACVAPPVLAQPKPGAPAPSPPPAQPPAAAPRATTTPIAALPPAQPAPVALPPPTARVAATQAAGAAPGAVAAATSPAAPAVVTDAPPKPPAIEVDDPLLAPVPPPAHVITGFKEVLNLLSNESLTLRIAQQDIERAKGQERVALAGMLPTLSATGQATVQPFQDQQVSCTPPGTPFCNFNNSVQPTRSSGAIRLAELLSARSWYAIGTAEKSVDAAKLRVEDARRQAIAAAASAIVAVVTAERVAEINRVGLRAALQRLELTKRRKRLGSGTDLDIVRAEQDAATARSQLVSGDETLRRARESLGQLFGKSDGYGVPVTFTLNDIEPALKSACKPAKAEERTDVLAAKVDLEVAQRGVTDVKLGFLPTLELSTSLSTVSQQTEIRGDSPLSISQQTSVWSIGALLTVPLWDGGARYGQMKTANAAVEQARTRVEQATVTATVEATQAQRAITVAEQARAVSEKARDLARETARLSQIAFESGAGTSLDLIDSGRVLRQAELDLAVRELEIVRAKIAAMLALSACNL